MKNTLKRFIKLILNSLGYEIKVKKQNNQNAIIDKLNALNIDMLFDVGANTGQSAIEYFSNGFKGSIVSFEPLLNEHIELKQNSKKYKNWIVAPRTAIGDKDGYIKINVAGNSGSSSILPMMETHSNAAPKSGYVGVQEVEIKKLDSVNQIYINESSSIFLKIDTQGYESQVLKGSSELLKQTLGLHLELSLVELYSGQTLWKELIEQVEKMGFVLWSIEPGFYDLKSGKMLQIDVIFFRN
jgi:FkbM family methyltransferase